MPPNHSPGLNGGSFGFRFFGVEGGTVVVHRPFITEEFIHQVAGPPAIGEGRQDLEAQGGGIGLSPMPLTGVAGAGQRLPYVFGVGGHQVCSCLEIKYNSRDIFNSS
jgi:hypothetical protein